MDMPLQGIKILDLSQLFPGPFCTMILADMGAEVLKVENPHQLDPFRIKPPFAKTEGAAYLLLNRNKRSMKLNLKTEPGKAILLQLVQDYDVLVEQNRPGVMARLGLGYEDIRKVNPQIIYCSISGYGQYGPYRDRGSHDINHVSITGVLNLLRTHEGIPAIPGLPLAGVAGGGLWAANAILAALLGRERNGSGQFLDVSMTDGLLMMHCMTGGTYLNTGQEMQAGDSQITGDYAYYNIYETLDERYVSLGAYEAKFWGEFCRRIGRPEFIAEQFAPAARQSEIIAAIQAVIKTRTLSEWMEQLGNLDLCLAPVQNTTETFTDPHFKARGMIAEIEHPTEGRLSTIAYPVKFSETPAQIKYPPPLHGEHTEEVLQAMGFSKGEVEELHRLDVI